MSCLNSLLAEVRTWLTANIAKLRAYHAERIFTNLKSINTWLKDAMHSTNSNSKKSQKLRSCAHLNSDHKSSRLNKKVALIHGLVILIISPNLLKEKMEFSLVDRRHRWFLCSSVQENKCTSWMSDLNQTDQQLDWSVSIWKCYSKMFYLEFSLDLKK